MRDPAIGSLSGRAQELEHKRAIVRAWGELATCGPSEPLNGPRERAGPLLSRRVRAVLATENAEARRFVRDLMEHDDAKALWVELEGETDGSLLDTIALSVRARGDETPEHYYARLMRSRPASQHRAIGRTTSVRPTCG